MAAASTAGKLAALQPGCHPSAATLHRSSLARLWAWRHFLRGFLRYVMISMLHVCIQRTVHARCS